MAGTNIYRVPSSTGNQKTFTFSFWWKTTPDNYDKCIFSSGLNSSNYFMVRTTGPENLQILTKDNGNTGINYNTNQSFRDANAWYHIVLTIDTTQGSGDRIKYYVNGERVTSFQSSIDPSQDSNILYVNDTTVHAWGRKNVTQDKYLNGSLSHVHFIDGTAYDASAFGETDATTGEWKIKTSPSVTYGTNGYFILKDGNSVTDQSGNSNNWQVGNGTLTKTEDCPSNVFATFNPLFVYSSGKKPAYSNGNNTATFDNAGENEHSPSTLAPSSGKYYAEFKWVSSHGNGATGVGIFATDVNINTDINAQSYLYMGNGEKRMLNSASAYGATWTTGDIISIALDCDNNTVTFYKNGATQGALSIASGNNYYMYCTDYDNRVVNANFGNGYFGTTAVSTPGTNASGNGIFEYDVPTGYTALSTKGLNL
jgi:hypothetical protein